MPNTAWVRSLSALSACTLACAASAVAAQDDADDAVRRSFDVAPGERVVVDTEFANIDVETWDTPKVDIMVERPDRLSLEFEQADGVVTVRGRKKGRSWTPWNWDRQPRFRLNVPYQQGLELRTSGGDITIDRLQGDVVARTSGGDVRIGDVDGHVDGKTSGGDVRIGSAQDTVAKTSGGGIRIGAAQGDVSATTSGGNIQTDRVAGDMVAKTSGGSIRIRGAHGAVQANTSGGSIEAEFVAQPGAPSELRTSGGSVTVYLPEDIALDVDARTSGGSVSTDFPVTVDGELGTRNKLQTAINGGGPTMALRTSGGSIRLRRLQP